MKLLVDEYRTLEEFEWEDHTWAPSPFLGLRDNSAKQKTCGNLVGGNYRCSDCEACWQSSVDPLWRFHHLIALPRKTWASIHRRLQRHATGQYAGLSPEALKRKLAGVDPENVSPFLVDSDGELLEELHPILKNYKTPSDVLHDLKGAQTNFVTKLILHPDFNHEMFFDLMDVHINRNSLGGLLGCHYRQIFVKWRQILIPCVDSSSPLHPLLSAYCINWAELQSIAYMYPWDQEREGIKLRLHLATFYNLHLARLICPDERVLKRKANPLVDSREPKRRRRKKRDYSSVDWAFELSKWPRLPRYIPVDWMKQKLKEIGCQSIARRGRKAVKRDWWNALRDAYDKQAAVDDNLEGLWEVERILDCFIVDNQRVFRVKWKNYRTTTLEPERNLVSCTNLVTDYIRTKGLPEVEDQTETLSTIMMLYLHGISAHWGETAEYTTLRNANCERAESNFAALAKQVSSECVDILINHFPHQQAHPRWEQTHGGLVVDCL